MPVAPATRRRKASRIVLVAGEASGDFHAALLAKHLRILCPQVILEGIGSRQMQAAGVRLLHDSHDWAAMGWTTSIRKIPRLLPHLWAMLRMARNDPPDLFILVDFGTFNVRLGAKAREAGVPVLYYFPPGSWSRTRARSKWLRRTADRVVSPYPWYAELLGKDGVSADYFGHPFLEAVEEREARSVPPNEKAGELLVGLLPGTREHEVRYILPPLLGAARLVGDQEPGARFLLSARDAGVQKELDRYLTPDDPLRERLTSVRDAHEILQRSRVVVAKSGSVTLEAALFRTPMVVVYRGTRFQWWQFRLLYRHVTWIALPNIVCEREVVPELIQYACTPEAIAEHVLRLLRDEKARAGMKAAFAQIREMLGPMGAARHTAELALEMAGAGTTPAPSDTGCSL